MERRVPWNKGRKIVFSAEHRKRLSIASKERSSREPGRLQAHARARNQELMKSPSHRRKLSRSHYKVPLPLIEELQTRLRPEDLGRFEYELRVWYKFRLTFHDLALMYDRQGQSCLCGKPLGDRFVIDHDHHTGRVRGLLHARCNTYLSIIVETPGITKVTAYLRGRDE